MGQHCPVHLLKVNEVFLGSLLCNYSSPETVSTVLEVLWRLSLHSSRIDHSVWMDTVEVSKTLKIHFILTSDGGRRLLFTTGMKASNFI